MQQLIYAKQFKGQAAPVEGATDAHTDRGCERRRENRPDVGIKAGQ